MGDGRFVPLRGRLMPHAKWSWIRVALWSPAWGFWEGAED